MSNNDRLKPLPTLTSDEDAERFVDEADLSEYDLSRLRPVRFELEKKVARVNMRLPQPLLDAVKVRSQARGIPYQRFILEAIERALSERNP